MQVRFWQPGDGPAAAALIQSILNDEFGFATTVADLHDVEHNGYSDAGSGLWLCHDAERIVGTAALLTYGDHHGALRRMFVAADRRGAAYGVGQALVDTLLAHARSHGLRDIALGTLARFEAALRFYAKNGFGQIPRNALPSGFPVMPPDDVFCLRNLKA